MGWPAIPLALCGLTIIIIAFTWYFVFNRSMRRIITTVIAVLLNRGGTIDPDAPIEAEKRVTASDKLLKKSDELPFASDSKLPSAQQKTRINIFAQKETNPKTLHYRIVQRIPKFIRTLPRPFRFLHDLSPREVELLDDVPTKPPSIPHHHSPLGDAIQHDAENIVKK